MSISPGFPSNCYSDPYPVAAADEVRSKRQRQGAGADHADVAGGLAAYPAERAPHLPERRKDDRPGCAVGRVEVGMTEFSAVPAYNPYVGVCEPIH